MSIGARRGSSEQFWVAAHLACEDRRVKNKPAAVIMGVVTPVFVIGAVVFSVAQVRESSRRSALLDDGIEVPLDSKTFIEADVRRVNPNTGQFNRYSDDQVLFLFTLPDGTELSAVQPIAEDRYGELGNIGGLSAVYLDGTPEEAVLLEDGDFVANAVPHWIFALLCFAFALGAGASAWASSRTETSVRRTGLSS